MRNLWNLLLQKKRRKRRNFDAWASPGGIDQMLFTAAAPAAFEAAGIRLVKVGGSSAGSFFALNVANRQHSQAIKNMLIECYLCKIEGLPTSTREMVSLLFTRRSKIKGATTEGLQQYIDRHFSKWKNMWILAVSEGTQILMSGSGSWRIYPDGTYQEMKGFNPPVSKAISGALAIPTIFASVDWQGVPLSDGAYSWDNNFPITTLRKFWNAEDDDIFAFLAPSSRLERAYLALLLGPTYPYLFSPTPPPAKGDIIVSPRHHRLPALQLKLSQEQRRGPIAHGLHELRSAFERENLLDENSRARLDRLAALHDLQALPKERHWLTNSLSSLATTSTQPLKSLGLL